MTIATVWMIIAATFGRHGATERDAVTYNVLAAAEWRDMIESATMRAGSVTA